MAIHRGFGATAGFGIEATWGLAVARTNWLRLMSGGLRRIRSKEVIPHLGSLGQVSTNVRDFFVASDYVEGPISFPMAYDDSTVLLMRHLLGANATTGAGPFTHTLTLSSPVPTGLTVEQISGTVGGTGNMAEVFEGCKAASGRISVEAMGIMSAEINMIGETSGGLVAAGTPTYSSGGEYIKHHHAGVFTMSATSLPIRAMTVNVDRGLARNHELGSLLTSEPVEDRLSVEVELTTMWQQAQWDTNYLADTQSDATIAFTSGAKSLSFTVHNALVTDVARPVSTASGIQQTIRLKAFADATKQGLSMVFVNGNSQHTAN